MKISDKRAKRAGGAANPLCIFIPTLTAGGAERVASILANHWCEARRIIIITYFRGPAFFEIDPRVTIECLGLQPNRGSIRRILDVVTASWRFRRLVGRLRPAFVLSFMNKYNAFCLAALGGSSVPVIVSERDSPIEKLPKARVIARDALYPLAAGLICQTERGREFITSRTNIRRAVVIPNPIDTIIEPGPRRAEKIILGVGRFVPKKGFDQLIAAFAAMSDDSWKLVLCGDGPLRAQLEAQAEALGVAGRTEFPGLLKDLRPHLSKAAIFAFPSLYEGFPNALAEAMVSGLPCVSYDCPTGPAELIDHGENGLLVPLGDVAGLTQCLNRLAQERAYAEQLGEQAALLGERLHPRRIAGEFLRFCEEAAR